MLIFLIPSWYPTEDKPTWCNWILPHVKITQDIGKTVILQVNQEAAPTEEMKMVVRNNHYYYPAPFIKTKFYRTRFQYGKHLKEYADYLELLYNRATQDHGKPDIIHAHVSMPGGYGAAMLGKKYNIPVIVTEHYSGFFSDNKFPWRIGSFYKKMRETVKGFYVVSPGFRTRIEEQTSIKVDGVIPNPIDTELFSQNMQRENDGILKLVTTGDIGLRKGTDILFEAVKKIPKCTKWELSIIGEGSNDKGFAEISIHPNIKVVARQSQNKLADIYSTSDVFIVSSRIETANVSMLEAMACGCYVVTSKIGAPETLLDKSVASFFDNSDSQQLAEILKKPITYNRENQINYVKNRYSKLSVTKDLKKLYEDILRDR